MIEPYRVDEMDKDRCLLVDEKELLVNLPLEPMPDVPAPPPAAAIIEDTASSVDDESFDDASQKQDDEMRVTFPALGVSTFAINGYAATSDGTEVTCQECVQKVSDDHFQPERSCSKCTFATSCVAAFDDHQKNAHRGHRKRKMDGERELTCGECRYSTCDGNDMGEHAMTQFINAHADTTEFILTIMCAFYVTANHLFASNHDACQLNTDVSGITKRLRSSRL